MRLPLLGYLLGLFALPVLSHGASFDCAMAHAVSDIMICASSDPSALDGQLQVAHQAARVATTLASRAALLTAQRHRVRYLRDVCVETTAVRRFCAADPHG
jgi:Uncharacterized protein conserved in bacteria, putative lipoprotein